MTYDLLAVREICKPQRNIISPQVKGLLLKSQKITNVNEDVEKRKTFLVHCWWERKLAPPLKRAEWSSFKKLKNRITI